MTALGKWLVVLHAGFSILLASMAVVLFCTRPEYDLRLKDKAAEVAQLRKSMNLPDAASREVETRVRLQALEGFWLNSEIFFNGLLQNTETAQQPNTIAAIERNQATGLAVPDMRYDGFVPVMAVTPATAELLGENAYTPLMNIERKALTEAQAEYQGLKKQALDLTLEAAGDDGLGGVTRQLTYERDQLGNLLLEQRTYEVETAVVRQDRYRVEQLLTRLRNRGQELKKYPGK